MGNEDLTVCRVDGRLGQGLILGGRLRFVCRIRAVRDRFHELLRGGRPDKWVRIVIVVS